jgi:hypothetical protein
MLKFCGVCQSMELLSVDTVQKKDTGKMDATIAYQIVLAKGWTVTLDLQSYDQNLKSVQCTSYIDVKL